MGDVYKARDTRLARTVALKVLPPHVAQDPQSRERLEREARAVAALNHPHICTLHDIGSHDGTDFLVMEYAEGETLKARLAKGPLPLDQALEYAIQLASALDRAHRAGIVHRDIKPGNIMLTRSGAKLLDFGLAKACAPAVGVETTKLTGADLTERGLILGTVQYMAPEQLECGTVDARSDIFAFGVVLYEMITGRKAFEGTSQASVIAAILQRNPPMCRRSRLWRRQRSTAWSPRAWPRTRTIDGRPHATCCASCSGWPMWRMPAGARERPRPRDLVAGGHLAPL